MKKLLRFKRILLTLLCLTAGTILSYGQSTFKYQSDIEGVVTSGIYKIHLQPTLIAKGNNDLSDLRIINDRKVFVPFSRLQNLSGRTEDFLAFPIISSSSADSITTLIVENKDRLLLRSLWINFRNAAVYRKADLLGSDDQKSWFAIQEDISLSQSVTSNTDNFLQSLTFPANKYRFFKVKIDNGKKEALKILQAGVFSSRQLAPAYTELPSPDIHGIDSLNKTTYLKLSFKERFLISKLSIDVASPKL